jgi:hypothetical protein
MPSEPNAISNQPINRRAKKPPTAMVAVATLEDRLLPSSANFVPDFIRPWFSCKFRMLRKMTRTQCERFWEISFIVIGKYPLIIITRKALPLAEIPAYLSRLAKKQPGSCESHFKLNDFCS